MNMSVLELRVNSFDENEKLCLEIKSSESFQENEITLQ